MERWNTNLSVSSCSPEMNRIDYNQGASERGNLVDLPVVEGGEGRGGGEREGGRGGEREREWLNWEAEALIILFL